MRGLGIENISVSQILEITRWLDERAAEFKRQELRVGHPFQWIDSVYEKVTSLGRGEPEIF